MIEERIATNLRKGVLEYCVLALLSRGEKYGLELADDLTARGLIASEGSLEPRWDSSGTARPRRYYAITADGTSQLAAFAQVWTSLGAQVNALLEGSR
jgi:PadR family transcriptional regulator PadR